MAKKTPRGEKPSKEARVSVKFLKPTHSNLPGLSKEDVRKIELMVAHDRWCQEHPPHYIMR